MEMTKMMMLSDSPLTVTGFGTVTKDLANRLSNKDWDVSVVGHNYIGQPIERLKLVDSAEFKFKLYPGGMAPYAQEMLPVYLQTIQPDIFWILLDTFMLFPWFLNYSTAPSKFIMYFPSDGEWFPTGCDNILRKAQYPVAMSKFGQAQVKRLFNIDAAYIPHGVNTDFYTPYTEEQKANTRRKWGLPDDAFILGSVARNQGRKMICSTIEIFAEFAKDKDDAILFLHTDPRDVAAHTDLVKIAEQLGCAHKIRFSGMKFYYGMTNEDMRDIYNIMDLHILTTTGEGFGIPTVEAMSCGVPAVITNYTTSAELTDNGKCGTLVDVATEIRGTWNVSRAFVDKEDFKRKLEYLYNNREIIKQQGLLSREKCIREYDWDRVVFPMWEAFLDKVKKGERI
jgi:glycosyltransferase involved in cell wall biosynthesis